ncbi:MAG: ribonuclease E/G [Roseburia sp.]
MYRYLITRQTILKKDVIVSALFDEGRHMIDVQADSVAKTSLLNNIYIAKVQNIVKNLDAAFVKISPEQTCYLSLKELHHPIYVKKISPNKDLVQGDEIVVQISKEAIKTKDPVVTTNLNFSGKYVVLTTGNTKIGISNKLDDDNRKYFKNLLEPYKNDEYGMIVRTNAKDASAEEILSELENLIQDYRTLKENAIHRTCYSCLYTQPEAYLKNISNLYLDSVEKILTDDVDFYQEITNYCQMQKIPIPVEFYQDPQLPLGALYGISIKMEEALKERVWLKSGAYLIIQPTEALTVIDVNSGKNVAKKDKWENFRRINLEAAEEIAKQLRLRNISGIIIVDFINLETTEADAELVQRFRSFLKKDPVPTEVWGMTKLGLVEVTRKKVRKSLVESLKEE